MRSYNTGDIDPRMFGITDEQRTAVLLDLNVDDIDDVPPTFTSALLATLTADDLPTKLCHSVILNADLSRLPTPILDTFRENLQPEDLPESVRRKVIEEASEIDMMRSEKYRTNLDLYRQASAAVIASNNFMISRREILPTNTATPAVTRLLHSDFDNVRPEDSVSQLASTSSSGRKAITSIALTKPDDEALVSKLFWHRKNAQDDAGRGKVSIRDAIRTADGTILAEEDNAAWFSIRKSARDLVKLQLHRIPCREGKETLSRNYDYYSNNHSAELLAAVIALEESDGCLDLKRCAGLSRAY